jgi:hypothetical protein
METQLCAQIKAIDNFEKLKDIKEKVDIGKEVLQHETGLMSFEDTHKQGNTAHWCRIALALKQKAFEIAKKDNSEEKRKTYLEIFSLHHSRITWFERNFSKEYMQLQLYPPNGEPCLLNEIELQVTASLNTPHK